MTPFLHHLSLCTLFLFSTLILDSQALIFNVRSLPTARAADGSAGSVALADKSNTQYVANITVGGSDFGVIIDTGSSDLWISGNPQLSSDTGVQVALQYAIGNASGTVNTAAIEFAGEAVANQSYLLVKDTSSFGNLASIGIDGLIGLGPATGSSIRSKVGNKTGGTVLDNIFNQNPSMPQFISFHLQRAFVNSSSGSNPAPGVFTIGEVAKSDSSFANITSQPKLPVQVLDQDSAYAQHWTVQLDEGGIIGPDGETIDVSSIVPNNNGRLFAVIDSGFTLPQVPRKVSDAIYGRVQGATFDEKNELWIVPCGQELNISFKLGGVKFPVHPLDTISDDFGLKDKNGNDMCVGSFQPITSAFSLQGEFDLILGMAFLRNAYTLLSFGSLFSPLNSNSNSSNSPPYVQMLSTTSPQSAHSAFVQTRLKGIDITGSSQYALLPKSKAKKSPVPLDERVKHAEQKVIRYKAGIATGVVVAVLLLAGGIGWRYMKRRRMRKAVEERRRKIEMQTRQAIARDDSPYVNANAYGGEEEVKYGQYQQPQPVYLEGQMYRGSYTNVYAPEYGYQQPQHYQEQQQQSHLRM